MTGGAQAFARALEFQRGTFGRVADRFEPASEGWVLRSHSWPLVWVVNQVRVVRPIQFADALERVEQHLAGLPYRHLAVEHEESGRRLESEFRSEGWEVDREVTMALVGEPDSGVDKAKVVEPDEEDALGLMSRWMTETEGFRMTPEAVLQLVEANRAMWRGRNARRLGVIGGSGRLAAIAMLFSDGVVAQVEDVYTVPEERGRGHARALVTHAASLARRAAHEVIFIAADDNDWPKQLYGQIGFEPVGHVSVFHRDLA
jgi:GNAT superfamily N-acetyltransferase